MVWWWGQLGISDAGPTDSVQIHKKNTFGGAKSLENHIKSSRRRGGFPGPSPDAKGPRFGSRSGTSLATKSEKILSKGIIKSNTKKYEHFNVPGERSAFG